MFKPLYVSEGDFKQPLEQLQQNQTGVNMKLKTPTEATLNWLSINFPTRESLEPIKRKIVDLMMVRHYPKLRFDDCEYRREADEYWFLFKWMDHEELVEWCEASGDSMDGHVDLFQVMFCVMEQNKIFQRWNEEIAKG